MAGGGGPPGAVAPPALTPLALTMGEPAGIGGELSLLAWQRLHQDGPPFLVLDDPDRLRALARRLSLDIPIAPIDDAAQAVPLFPRALPVLPVALPVAVQPGQPVRQAAAAVIGSIER